MKCANFQSAARRDFSWVLVLLITCAFFACGGGGGETPDEGTPDTTVPEDSAVDVASDTKVPDTTLPPTDAGPCAPDECECEQDSDCPQPDSICLSVTCNLESYTCESTAHTGTVCDDGDLCTSDDACDESGACTGTTYGCSELPCLNAQCNGEGGCTIDMEEGYCAIDGECHITGSSDPSNSCSICDPSQIPFAWTPQANCTQQGLECVDGLPCGSEADCGEDSACITGGCFCYKSAGANYCGGCLIDEELCYEPGVPNPSYTCEYCNPAQNSLGWTQIAGCGQLLPCFQDLKCDLDSECGFGLCASEKCDCASCDEKAGQACLANSQCGVSGSCVSKVCQCAGLVLCNGCIISGTCYPNGTLNTSSSCLTCDKGNNSQGWTAVSNGESCDDGNGCTFNDTCAGGQCIPGPETDCHDDLACTLEICLGTTNTTAAHCFHPLMSGYCVIDNACVEAGAVNPEDSCLTCNPLINAFAWSPPSDGDCGGDPVCVQGASCSTDVECVESTDNQPVGLCLDGQCDCVQWCVPGASCDVSASCGVGGTCQSDNSCTCGPPDNDCFGCLIDGICYPNQINHPTNSCKFCDLLVNPIDWAEQPNGSPCDADANACTVSDSCQGGQCEAGPLMSCADDLTCTLDACASVNPIEAFCVYLPVDGFCVLGGACVVDGDLNPENECLICDALATAYSWTLISNCPPPGGCVDGDPCDDGDPCTVDDTCADGDCQSGSAMDCTDGLSCTSDSCDSISGQCTHQLNSGRCLIGGDCYDDGDGHPNDPCAMCISSTSPHTWSAAPMGTLCDDGNSCTQADYCQWGYCSGQPVCPQVPASTSPCIDAGCFPNASGAPTCNPQVFGCVIGNQCHFPGATNPLEDCQECSATNPSGWSNKSNGTNCNLGTPCAGSCQNGVCEGTSGSCPADGIVCTWDTCVPGDHQCYDLMPGYCMIGGVCVPQGTTSDTNPCMVCDTSVSSSGWSPGNNGASCDENGCTNEACVNGNCAVQSEVNCADALFCTADDCVSTGPSSHTCENSIGPWYCIISNICVPAGTTDNGNTCMICNPAYSQSGFTAKVDGSFCTTGSYCDESCQGGSCQQNTCADDGKICTWDDCLSGQHDCGDIKPGYCKINGACYTANQPNPNNDCEKCVPTNNNAHWSPANTGMDCDTDGDPCTKEACSVWGSCTLIGNPCTPDILSCTDTCVPDGAGGYDCNVLQAGACIIGGQCYSAGAANPTNPCQHCDPNLNASGWTAKSEGSTCDLDGSGCTVEECHGGSCIAWQSIDCGDGIPCTNDDCISLSPTTYQCDNDIHLFSCLIGDECYAMNEEKPDNECMGCVPSQSQTSWSPINQGDDCEADGDGCTQEICQGGSCVVDEEIDCDDEKDCTDDVCESLSAFSHECVNDLKPGWCWINNECIEEGEPAPGASCMGCNPQNDPLIWSPLVDCTECQASIEPGCPETDDYCIDGSCEKGWYEGYDMCSTAQTDPCIFQMVAQIVCWDGNQTQECGATHPDNSNLVCGFPHTWYPSCGGSGGGP